jgi:hypothetical protein
MTLNQYEFARYDYGRTITGKIYEEDGSTAFNATGLTGVVKAFKRHGDRAFFFRDVARALTVIGQVAQLISDVDITWTTQASGEFSFAWTAEKRPHTPGYMWLEVQMVDSPKTKQISTELIRVMVTASEGA